MLSGRRSWRKDQPERSVDSPMRDRLLGLAMTVLGVALMLYVAARLILAVLPVILVIAGVVLVGFVGWSFHRFWQSRL